MPCMRMSVCVCVHCTLLLQHKKRAVCVCYMQQRVYSSLKKKTRPPIAASLSNGSHTEPPSPLPLSFSLLWPASRFASLYLGPDLSLRPSLALSTLVLRTPKKHSRSARWTKSSNTHTHTRRRTTPLLICCLFPIPPVRTRSHTQDSCTHLGPVCPLARSPVCLFNQSEFCSFFIIFRTLV